MAYVIDRQTKEISTRDTVAALSDPAVLVYHKREIPADVLAAPAQYRVIDGDDVRTATSAEREAIDAEAAIQTIAAVRQRKLQSLIADCEALQRAGVQVGPYTLAATEYDQRRFATLLVGINNAIEVGAMTADSPVTFWDAAGQPQTVTVSQFKQIAAGYMAACMALEMRLATAQQAVAAATTQDQIEAVTI